MTTTTDIANFALAALGAGQINDISDAGQAAVLCNQWVGDAIEAVLLEGQWQCQIERTVLQPIGAGIDAWEYSYQIPNNLVTLIEVILPNTLSAQNAAMQTETIFSNDPPLYTGNNAEFMVEADVLYTMASPITLKYVASAQNIGNLPVLLTHAIGYRLALLVGPGLDTDLQKLQWVEMQYNRALGRAGRFEKRDKQFFIPRRTWGAPT